MNGNYHGQQLLLHQSLSYSPRLDLLQDTQLLPQFLRHSTLRVLLCRREQSCVLLAVMEPDSQESVLEVALLLLLGEVPEFVEYLECLWLFACVVDRLEESEDDLATPVEVDLVGLFEEFLYLLQNLLEVVAPLGTHHRPDYLEDRDADVVYEKSVFDFVVRGGNLFQGGLDILESLLDVVYHLFCLE